MLVKTISHLRHISGFYYNMQYSTQLTHFLRTLSHNAAETAVETSAIRWAGTTQGMAHTKARISTRTNAPSQAATAGVKVVARTVPNKCSRSIEDTAGVHHVQAKAGSRQQQQSKRAAQPRVPAASKCTPADGRIAFAA